MDVKIPKGKYVLAVSGGVDSMVLLDILRQKDGIELVVAHFNHGIRDDADKDEELVRKRAAECGIGFEAGRAQLGKSASEAVARVSRYKFLEEVRQKYAADAIITAHHQDDLIETALLNTLRGTKRRGLTALADSPEIIRPLLRHPKADILEYAKAHKLKWREDITNKDEKYLRNFIRARLAAVPRNRLDDFAKQIEKSRKVNREIDELIATISRLLIVEDRIDRRIFSRLPADIAREVIHYWLRQSGLAQADRKLVDRAMTFIRTGPAGKKLPLSRSVDLKNSIHVSRLWKDKS